MAISFKTIEAIVTVVTTRYISHGYVSGVASERTGSTSLSTASSEDHITGVSTKQIQTDSPLRTAIRPPYHIPYTGH